MVWGIRELSLRVIRRGKMSTHSGSLPKEQNPALRFVWPGDTLVATSVSDFGLAQNSWTNAPGFFRVSTNTQYVSRLESAMGVFADRWQVGSLHVRVEGHDD